MKKKIAIILSLALTTNVWSQGFVQNIRGIVIDKQSQSPIPGVNVMLLNVSPVVGTTTDINGRFVLPNVPIGRVGVQFSFVGYNQTVLNNMILTSGKELILNVSLEESVKMLSDVIIVAKHNKANPLNEMATVSARSFSIDETNRYAGTLADPSRMAANFAGVAVSGDSRNDIIIRGNSPMGLLWRLDGINIPNPNHFGALGTTGGPVSMLNNNLLDNSDFMTGAFPAEYGNALSGAFDLRMRTGNNEKHEFVGQMGFNGFELGAEGPLTKNHNGSYIVNYRYSVMDIMNALGIKIGYTAIPQYQDLSFKIDLPTGTKYGRFSLFGIGGKSYIELLDKNKQEGDFSVTPFDNDVYFGSNMGVLGFSHIYFFNEKTKQTVNLAISGTQNTVTVDSLYNNKEDKFLSYGQKSSEIKYSLCYNINKKINASNTFNTGIIADVYDFNYNDSALQRVRPTINYITIHKFNGNSSLMQAYIKWQHKFSDKLILNTGIHYQQFLLNNSLAVEPRLGIKWNIDSKQSISTGVGMHSQLQPMSIYFYETHNSDNTYTRTNNNLDFSKSNHFVVAYDNAFATNWRVKTEIYYQQLYDIPVETTKSTFSVLNIGADFVIPDVDNLKNNGTGDNRGVELTIEKFFNKDYYFLITASLFDSKYKGSDGIKRNTAFNGGYTLNALAGAEFNLDKKNSKVITINTKVNYAGGKCYIPTLLAESQLQHKAVYDYAHAYEKHYPDYSRVDIKIGFKLNLRKITQEWDFEIQNILNRKNIFQQIYNPKKGDIQTEYQLGIFPMMTYRILF
ncbi:MAG: TonB-dependent receptor [Bacteroidota bacterium]